MYSRVQFFFAVILLVSSSVAFSQEPQIQLSTPKQLYFEGVKNYQSKDYKKASESFRMAFEKAPMNRSILFNWGLSEYQLGHIGMAAAAWRRTLSMDPDFGAARRALNFISPKISAANAGEKSFFETFRSIVLQNVTGMQIGLLGLLLFIVTGWTWLSYFGKHRRALIEQKSFPSFPVFSVIYVALLALTLFTGVGKIYDFFQPRATIVTTSASVFSGPNDKSPTLFEISEGFEVILRRRTQGWSQVASPGGLSGWVKQESLFQTSGFHRW
ncbi:MAG: hypothetical protein KDD22_09125 [Bdellovibrionales bacterium]|nr:hypothetical protein [Bdellovibrionales bacterium]